MKAWRTWAWATRPKAWPIVTGSSHSRAASSSTRCAMMLGGQHPYLALTCPSTAARGKLVHRLRPTVSASVRVLLGDHVGAPDSGPQSALSDAPRSRRPM